MAITVANRLSNLSDADATSYLTASITPTNGCAWVLFVYSSRSGATPPDLTISGCSLTWASLGAVPFGTGGTLRRIQMFSGVGTPSTGQITIDAGAVTLTSAAWCLDEISGGDLTTPVVAGSVVTNGGGPATSGSITYNAAADSNNRPIACFAHGTGEVSSPRASWTELNDVQNADPAAGTETQYRSDTFETTGSATWATSSRWGGIGGELAIVAAAVTYVPRHPAHDFGSVTNF